MSALREFITLLWKNWIVQKRRRCVTAFEVILPLLFWAIVIILRVVLSFFGSRNTYSDAENTVLVNKAVNDYRRDSYLILYTPNTTAARQAVELLETFNVISNVRGVGFASEEDLVRAYESGMYPSGRDLIGVVFDGNFVDKNSIPRQMTMTIRQAYSYRGYVNTRSMFDRKDGSCYQDSLDHLYVRDFVPLQYGLMRGITELQAPTVNLTRDVNISLHRMPCKDRTHDEFFDGAAFEISVPVLTVFCYLIFAVQITQNIVSEKQKKLTIWLQMLGVREKSQWIAWFVKWLIQLTILNIIITVLAAVPMPTVPIVGKSQASLFFLLMVFYSVATIAFCFMISSFFQKATPGAVASAVFFLLTYMPYIGLQLTYERRSIHSLLASSLLHNVALGLGCQAMTNYQTVDEGVQWTNFFRPAAHEQDLSFLLVLIMLLVDSALYLLVTWYVRGVFPGRHGVALSWYFPFTRSYWRRSYRVNYEINTVPLPEGAMNSLDAGEFFQADPTDKSLGIAIRGLRKVFGSGKSGKVAVADVVLNVYKGQITALLGHNGAGKTTTLSMLTGFLPPTSGTATINEQDIRHNPDVAAKTVGLCPQDDILFDLLTVREHLVFFAKLRGERPEFIDENVYQVIHDLGLGSCAHKQVGRLSGGKRRAVSVAIALLTSSQIVILDEPTSGMDPASRHQVWSALQKHKENKAILFTTHNMDEADSLSDRVAIMSQGVIKCSGSPLYLKNNYGVGYHLRILKGPRCDVLSTKNLVTEHVPDAVECCNLASALVMTLPKEHSSRFYILFGALEKEKERLDIENFSVAFTTMEDVFLRFGRSTSEQTDLFRQVGNSVIDDFDDILQTDERRSSQVNLADSTGIKLGQYLDFNEDLSLASGWSLAMKQFRAGVYKKCLLSWRNPFLLLVQIIATIILVSVGYGVATIREPDQPPLDLDTTNLWENEVPYDYDPEGPEARKLVQGLLSTLKGSESVAKNVGNLGIEQYLSQKAHQVSYATYTREFIIGQTFRVNSTVDMRGFYNSKSSHGIAVSLSTVMNTLLKYYVHPESSVKIINHPLPEVRDDDNFFSHTPIFSIVGAFSLGLLSSTFIVQLLKERNSKAKHLQIVSGMKPWVYWLSTFAWDMVIMLIPIFCLLIVIAAFDDKAYTGGGRMGYVFFVLLLYAWATLPFTYLWSFIFKSQVCGFVTMLMLNILSGPVLLTVIFVASMFNAAHGLRDGLGFGFGALLPNVALGTALSGIARNYGYAQTCSGSGYCRRAPQDYLGFVYPGVGGYLLILFFQGIVYFLLVLAAEYPMSHRKQNPVSVPDGVVLEDEDVRKERNRIMSNDTANTNSLVIQNLSRRHGSKIVSVNNISLGVSCDECFGLLGANGAGKTTTFRILSGEDRKFSGEAFINGKSVSADLREAYGTIGYCTQKDTLLHLLTGRETLTFFAHLKGVHDKRIKAVVDELLATLFLQEDADKLSDIYSIGNKRKLSTAIALLGDPPMLLLDEPTAGVDPVAKRRVWNVLTDVRASGRTILLTSHSMEECDALCTRLSIMVNGRLMCLGSPQHLKNKFGQGYTLTIRVEVPNQSETSPASDGRSTIIELQDTAQWTRIQAVKTFLTSAFPSHKLVPCADDTVKCNLSDTSVPLSYVFRVVEEAKQRLCIADYSVNQTSLEDVFLYLASYQLNPSVC